jgi:hypothetical protein
LHGSLQNSPDFFHLVKIHKPADFSAQDAEKSVRSMGFMLHVWAIALTLRA